MRGSHIMHIPTNTTWRHLGGAYLLHEKYIREIKEAGILSPDN